MTDREKVIKKAERIMCSTVDRDMIDSFCEDVIALLEEQEAMKECLKKKCVICPHCANCDVDENGLLKEQEEMLVEYSAFGGMKYGGCPRCNARIDNLVNPKACGFCGQAVKWE